MTEEPKRRGRQPKSHLQEDHHFRTSDDAAAAGAPPAPAESGQENVSDALPDAGTTASAFSAPIHEAVVENPTLAPYADIVLTSETISPTLVASSIESTPSAENVDTITNSSQPKESPIEQKIHELVDAASLNGWHVLPTEIAPHPSLLPPRNGMPVRLSETTDGEGILVFWKKTRKYANTTHRWEHSGKWCDFQTGLDINFIPKYWRERF